MDLILQTNVNHSVRVQDPWGRPYRLILGKLRIRSSPVTETLNPDSLKRALDVLFPACQDELRPVRPTRNDLLVPATTEEEFDRAISRMVKKNTAPDLDGIPSRALALVLRELNARARSLLNGCLGTGKFPGYGKQPS